VVVVCSRRCSGCVGSERGTSTVANVTGGWCAPVRCMCWCAQVWGRMGETSVDPCSMVGTRTVKASEC